MRGCSIGPSGDYSERYQPNARGARKSVIGTAIQTWPASRLYWPSVTETGPLDVADDKFEPDCQDNPATTDQEQVAEFVRDRRGPEKQVAAASNGTDEEACTENVAGM